MDYASPIGDRVTFNITMPLVVVARPELDEDDLREHFRVVMDRVLLDDMTDEGAMVLLTGHDHQEETREFSVTLKFTFVGEELRSSRHLHQELREALPVMRAGIFADDGGGRIYRVGRAGDEEIGSYSQPIFSPDATQEQIREYHAMAYDY